MDSVKNKVITELFLAPSVVLPIVGGISAGLLSWASGGSTTLSGVAMVGILGGIGWAVTRMIFNLESMTEEVMQAQVDRQVEEENERLDALARKLRTDRDHRTQDYLTLLRSLRSEFEEQARESGQKYRSARVRDQMGQIFYAAVRQLEQSYKLWELSESLNSVARDKVLEDREQVLAEVDVTIDQVRTAVKHYQDIVRVDGDLDLATMRDELDASMRIAQRTEERMRELESPQSNYDSKVSE